MAGSSSWFIGSTELLISCAERWLSLGNELYGVISECPKVQAWAEARNIVRGSPDNMATLFARQPFDYLFSVINHTVLPPAVLRTPRRHAINFHDSLLPDYAGFNATAWAIIDGKAIHGITWHEMETAADSGSVLLQQDILIDVQDTAFTLSVKCAEAGRESFVRLLDHIDQDHHTGSASPGDEQSPLRNYHLRHERPGLGLLDFRQPAERLEALVCGLDFGPDDNWMCRAKVRASDGVVLIGRASVQTGSEASPGTIISVGDDTVTVSTSEGALRISDLAALDGKRVSPAAIGLQEGQKLEYPDDRHAADLAELDRELARHERFWVRRLATSTPARLPGSKPKLGASEPVRNVRPLPAALKDMSAKEREAALIAALAAYLARVGETTVFDFAVFGEKQVPAEFYAGTVPMRCDVDLAASFEALRNRIAEEMAAVRSKGTYARDALVRYRALTAIASEGYSLPIGVCSGDLDAVSAEDCVARGPMLTLMFDPDASNYAWCYDKAALDDATFREIVDRVEALLACGLAPEQHSNEIAKLDMLSAAEHDVLQQSWQGADLSVGNEPIFASFERQAERTPDATAVAFRGTSLTYRQLNRRANHVARLLQERGVGPDTLVGISIERSVEMMIALLGILKAGGAYVPLDPAYPAERLRVMLEDAGVKLVLTQRHLSERLPVGQDRVLLIDDDVPEADNLLPPPVVAPENLAYVIFTSGSTGRPKGVMVTNANVANFFAGMDRLLGTERGVWLAVTSISFDISVLELFWTLTRGFEVIIQGEIDRASLARKAFKPAIRNRIDFGLFYFAASQSDGAGNPYRLLLEGAKFADAHGFSAVWTPERHFHAFGGPYPNPAITTAALATITDKIALRAGSVVLPLHNPLRVAEDWAVIDQLSGGRVGLSFASGWHANDFALMPESYQRRREIMFEHIDTVLKLWRGDSVEAVNGLGATNPIKVLPRPVQAEPPMWIAAAGSVDTFVLAGRLGANVLTNMLGQDLEDLKPKIAAYRASRRDHGHDGPGNVTVMLHTFVCEDTERARDLVRKPFCDYLASSFDLIKMAPAMFPAFRQPSAGSGDAFDPSTFTEDDKAALLDHAFDRYFDTAGLFGTPERALDLIGELSAIGVNEVACLIDFGIAPDAVLDSLPHLDRLRRLANDAEGGSDDERFGIVEQLANRRVTHMQCTPSMARMLTESGAADRLGTLKFLLVGGEALPSDLADVLTQSVDGKIYNMYGPTETTVWSTTSLVEAGQPITIGRPIVNTTIRILDKSGQLAPIGTAGELCIGGKGVALGYIGRDDLTAQRFIVDPCVDGQRLYRTGDLARHNHNGEIEFLGRMDQQLKINGYRIEIGDIEATLNRHPRVRQAVVVAQADPARLTAFVVPSVQQNQDANGARVNDWRKLWDDAYRQSDRTADRRFNTAGWIDSFSGSLHSESEMREWLDETIERILAHRPKRVLEVGCGTGMLLYRLLPHVVSYTGIDFSLHALEQIRAELSADEKAKVTLLELPAHGLHELAEKSYDTIVINSVAQYFPDADYLIRALSNACALVREGGRIILGDIRDRDHLRAFHTLAAVHRAPADLSLSELAARIDKREREEGELVLSPDFFHALADRMPLIAAVNVRLKRAAAHNEMSMFRYDVVLHIGEKDATSMASMPPMNSDAKSLDDISQMLAAKPPVLHLENVPNARLDAPYAVCTALSNRTATDIESLRTTSHKPAIDGIDPADLIGLHPNYTVDLLPARSGNRRAFDAVFRNVDAAQMLFSDPGPLTRDAPESYANCPVQTPQWGDVPTAGELGTFAREHLPEYMVPSAFLFLEDLPLTPNGKIDRVGLVSRKVEKTQPTPGRIAPSNETERAISQIWKDLLNIETVGLNANIFDLGANSLLTVQANQRLSSILNRKISLISMFRFPTVELLAAHLSEGETSSAPRDVRNEEAAMRKKGAAERRRQLREAMGQK